MDEAGLITRSRDGDMAAYEQLVAAYQDRVYGLTYRITGNREDAWDAAQEAFIKACRSLSGFRQTATFSTWLYRIAHNAALDIVRRRPQRPPTSLEDVILPVAESPSEQVERRDAQRRILQAIAMLPTEQRAIVVLRDIHGLRYEEIASVLSVPVGTVRSRLSRAREGLRAQLADLEPAR